MIEESGCFDPNAMMVLGTGVAGPSEDCFAQIVSESDPPLQAVMTGTGTGTGTEIQNSFAENVGISAENLSYPYSCGEDVIIATGTLTNRVDATAGTRMDAHPQQMGFHMENPYHHSNNFNSTHLVEEVNNNHVSSQDLSFDQSNWDKYQRVSNSHHHQNHHHHHQQLSYPASTPDLLNLLHLPRSPASPFGNSSISFENPTHNTTNLSKPTSGHATWVGNCPMGPDSTNGSSVSYDPFLHLNLQVPPPAVNRKLFQPLPHGYTMTASRNDFVFSGGDDIQGSGVAYQDGDGRDFDNGVLELTKDVAYVGKKRGGKRTKHFTSTTEKQRRVDLSSKFDALKELIPNPSKSDRASVVGDAIDYIRELLRTVNELKLLVEKKRHEKKRIKGHKLEEGATQGDLEGCNLKLVAIGDPDDRSLNESLRSSWIQRRSKDTEVDVHIIDNEVTIKLVQRKKINCLVYASQVLEEFKLDLQHVAGGHIGDFCSFMFNGKICEGSSVYASAIANKLIEIIDRSLTAA
ncbi:transcription factor bHLH89-like [Gastrolobium bilobum]|uniref:transcription factor bHLH89-like n=1 Tax=Gastrolobium bilobum TaxID=150636 RepID=UPI002AB164F4|nr:transcription factor bHLH89-like [Gastrolobium bilobum]